MKKIIYIFPLLLSMMFAHALAQNTSYKLAKNSQIIVEGTSTVHDWAVEINDIQSNLAANINENDISFMNTSLDIKVDDMKSGKGRMDRLMHDALKKDKHPIITFRLDPAQTKTNGANGNLMVAATGTMKIAGIERVISVDLEGKKNGNNEIEFTGATELQMSDYEVDPPTAMLGTIRSGNDITVRFDLKYSPVN
ncbi:MAG: YceI family protein [Balneolales bacterium]